MNCVIWGAVAVDVGSETVMRWVCFVTVKAIVSWVVVVMMTED